MNWMKYENNQFIKTVKEHLNNTAENLFYGTHLLSTVQTWETNLLSPKFYVFCSFKAL